MQTAKAGRTAPADMTGGTLTITNVGVFGVDTGTPILPPGESAILAFGAVREMPWVHKGKVRPRQVTTLALSFDHRIIDGELGSKFLRDIGDFLDRSGGGAARLDVTRRQNGTWRPVAPGIHSPGPPAAVVRPPGVTFGQPARPSRAPHTPPKDSRAATEPCMRLFGRWPSSP